MNIQKLAADAKTFFADASFVHRITTSDDYDKALKLMDGLIEDYDENIALIDILWPNIEAWESTADEFKDFRDRIEALNGGSSALRVIMAQYQLTTSDFKEEIGGKSLVSLITNDKRQLTVSHIRALSKRFNLNPSVFI